MSNHKKECIREVIDAALASGYRAFLAESEEYGFYTDETGSRVISFQIDFFSPRFSGNYVTSRPAQTGTGWQITNEENVPTLDQAAFDDMFNTGAPRWAVKDATWRHTTLADHLKQYGRSSRYVEQTA